MKAVYWATDNALRRWTAEHRRAAFVIWAVLAAALQVAAR